MKRVFSLMLLAILIFSCSSDDGNTVDDENQTTTDNCGYSAIIGDVYCQIENPLNLQSVSDIPDNDIPFVFQIVETVTTSEDLMTSFGVVNNETERTFVKIRSVNLFYLQSNLGDLSNLTNEDWEFTYYSVRENCQLGVPTTYNGNGFKVNMFNLTDCSSSLNNKIEFIQNNDNVEVFDLCGQFEVDDVARDSFIYFKIDL